VKTGSNVNATFTALADGRVKLDFVFEDGTRFGFETSYAFAHEMAKMLASTVKIAAFNAMVSECAHKFDRCGSMMGEVHLERCCHCGKVRPIETRP